LTTAAAFLREGFGGDDCKIEYSHSGAESDELLHMFANLRSQS